MQLKLGQCVHGKEILVCDINYMLLKHLLRNSSLLTLISLKEKKSGKCGICSISKLWWYKKEESEL